MIILCQLKHMMSRIVFSIRGEVKGKELGLNLKCSHKDVCAPYKGNYGLWCQF